MSSSSKTAPWQWVTLVLLVVIVLYAVIDWRDLKEGFRAGYEAQRAKR